VLVIDNAVVAQVLTPADVVEALDRSYEDLATGEGVCRPRIDLRIPAGDGTVYQWGTMDGGSARTGYAAIRMKSDVLTEVDHAGVRTQEKHCIRPGLFCGLVLLLSVRTGEPLALINDGHLQHLRVAADSAIGTRHAARPDARVLGMLGSGGMARSHVEAVLAVRDLRRVQIFSPTRANRERFAAELAERFGLEAVAVDEPADAIRGADLVAGCTDAAGDVVFGEHLADGAHVTCIGGRLDAAAQERLDVWLRLADASRPDPPSTWATEDEYVAYRARPHDAVWREHRHGRGARRPPTSGARVVRLADVLQGRATARESDREVTFSERGNAQGAQFHAVAAVVYERARAQGLGREIPTSWLVQDIRD
jgi:alanine dehydrogenase